MRLRTLPPGSPAPRRRRRLRTIQLLPTLMTAGNLVAGMLACAYMIDAGSAAPAQVEVFYERAAWLIFIGMFLDGLDGRVARMTGTTSAFGAQLDSLADVVTFGMAPALIAKTMLGAAFADVPTRIAFGLCLVYALGAAFRLARYNVESERLSRAGRPHVTRTFRGLPSPAAAGVLASLVLLRHEYGVADTLHLIEWTMLAIVPLLGLLMISRMPFSHILNRYFDRRRAHPATVVVLMLLVYLVIAHFVETVAGLFLLYALSGPFLTLTHRLWGFPAYVEHEDGDEEDDVAPLLDEDDLDLDEDDMEIVSGGDPPERGTPSGTGTGGAR